MMTIILAIRALAILLLIQGGESRLVGGGDKNETSRNSTSTQQQRWGTTLDKSIRRSLDVHVDSSPLPAVKDDAPHDDHHHHQEEWLEPYPIADNSLEDDDNSMVVVNIGLYTPATTDMSPEIALLFRQEVAMQVSEQLAKHSDEIKIEGAITGLLRDECLKLPRSVRCSFGCLLFFSETQNAVGILAVFSTMTLHCCMYHCGIDTLVICLPPPLFR